MLYTSFYHLYALNKSGYAKPKLTYGYDIANKQVMIGQKCNKNLKDLLVRSCIRYPPTPNTGSKNPSRWISPSKVCNKTNCLYCPHLDKSGRATSANTNRTYIIPQHTSCMFNNIIYLITCTKCGLQYVGQTKRTLNKHLYEHFRDIKHATDHKMPHRQYWQNPSLEWANTLPTKN